MHPGFTRERYETAVVNMKPVRYWRLSETSGTVLRDRMNVTDGTTVGTLTQLAWQGPPGIADGTGLRTTAGSGGTATAGNNAFPSTAYTLAAWTFITAQPNPDAGIIGKWANGTGAMIYKPNSIRIIFLHRSTSLTSTSAPPLNRWAFVVGTWTGTQLNFYVNGIREVGPISNSTAPGDTGLWSLNTYQVVNVYTSRILTGTIAEPAYWDRALSAGEIAYLAALGFGR